MSEMFDKKAAQVKYLNNIHYHALVDSLVSMFTTGTILYGDAFSAVEFACCRADEYRLKELGGP